MVTTVIAIGDELLIGQVTDTNSGWIARHINPLGWSVDKVMVVKDDKESIIKAVDDALKGSDIVFVTGGLGPTKDDITKHTLCEYFGGEMVMDEATLRNVEEIVAKRNLRMNKLNELQAMVPSSCRVIQNEVGTAPLMWWEKDRKVLVSMPGVPFEMETMMEREVIPQLIAHFCKDQSIEHHTFVVVGYPESELAIKLDEFERQMPDFIHLAYLPKPGIMRLRLSGASKDAEQLSNEMKRLSHQLDVILGDAIVCHGDKTISEIIGEKLREKGMTVSTAESCTGGNIAHEITAIAGSSAYYVGSVVCYTNDIKHKVLKVPAEVLAKHGAVSEPTVRQMAQGVSEFLGSDCAMATSGIAGPGGATPTKPVGTVWMAVKVGDRVVSQCRQLPGTRARVIDRATTEVQLMLLKELMK